MQRGKTQTGQSEKRGGHWGASAVTWHVKVPLAVLASPIVSLQVLAALPYIQLTTSDLGKQKKIDQMLEFLPPSGKSRWSSWFLDLAWHRLGCSSYLGCEPAMGDHSLSLSCTCSFKQIKLIFEEKKKEDITMGTGKGSSELGEAVLGLWIKVGLWE